MPGEIEQFLYHEAHLLDAQRFEEWPELFTRSWTMLTMTGGSGR